MEIAVHTFLTGLREAVTIWLVLVAFIVLTVSGMCVPGRRHRRVERRAALAVAGPAPESSGEPAAPAPAGSVPADSVAGSAAVGPAGPEPVDTASAAEPAGAGPAAGRTKDGDRALDLDDLSVGATASLGPDAEPVAAGASDAPAGRRHRRRRLTRRRQRQIAAAAQALEVIRYAEEITVAASRAAVTADRCHDEWAAAVRARDEAWEVYRRADEAAVPVLRANAFRLPASARTPAEYAARERYLHRAATEAYRRGELTVQQLWDALAARNGWDPRRHPFEQESALRRLARDQRLREYLSASRHEQRAWHAAELATASRRSLADEAIVAIERARRLAVHAVPAPAVRSRPGLRVVQPATLATR